MVDSRWLAELLSYGLLRPSFVPPQPIRELRDLTRYRVHLKQDRNRIHNRVHKVLEDAPIKLDCVATDILAARVESKSIWNVGRRVAADLGIMNGRFFKPEVTSGGSLQIPSAASRKAGRVSVAGPTKVVPDRCPAVPAGFQPHTPIASVTLD